MNNNQPTEGHDFFEEIQKKVDQDIFPGDPEETTEDALKDHEPEVKASDFEWDQTVGSDIEIEVVTDDSEISDLDMDDSFLEEVDVLDEVEPFGPSAGISESSYEMAEQVSAVDSVVSTSPPPLDETPDFQEDDRYISELIEQEMVEKEPDQDSRVSDPFLPEDPPPVSHVESHEVASHEQDGKDFTTRTLGDLYAEQGHLDKAMEIYQDLLEADPGDHDLQKKYEDLRAKLAHSTEAEHEPIQEESPSPVVLSQGSQNVAVQRLESWLARIRAQEERRCLKSC